MTGNAGDDPYRALWLSGPQRPPCCQPTGGCQYCEPGICCWELTRLECGQSINSPHSTQHGRHRAQAPARLYPLQSLLRLTHHTHRPGDTEE